jgi:hypothetical protein
MRESYLPSTLPITDPLRVDQLSSVLRSGSANASVEHMRLPGLVFFAVCPIVATAQQNEVVRTLADIRASTGARVLVESVNTGITMPRVTVSRGSEEASLTFGGPDLESWAAELDTMINAKVSVGRDEVAKNYSSKLGMEDHTFVQFVRVTEFKSVTNLFMISNADDRVVIIAPLTRPQALGLMRALRRGSLLAQGRTVADAPIERQTAPRSSSPNAQSSVLARCLAAAHLQTEASDETTGRPSRLQYDAREANIRSICATMPAIYLPELR